MAKKRGAQLKVNRDPHKWWVGLIMWVGIIISVFNGDISPALVGIGVVLAYLVYYK